VNIVTGWQPKEYQQMGLWPGEAHFAQRYDYATEYVRVMKELWETGTSNFQGQFFQMDDCKLSPRPSSHIDIVAAGTSDRGMKFVADHCDYNFVSSGGGINEPDKAGANVMRLSKFAEESGRKVQAYTGAMIIADRTDELAFAKWEHYKKGTDHEAIAWAHSQSSQDTKAASNSTAGGMAARTLEQMRNPASAQPNNGLRLIGSYENVARMLDVMAQTPGLGGIMLTFDDFITGIEQFGQYIQPRMRSRTTLTAANAA
jgi:pyrimidine oxygenase